MDIQRIRSEVAQALTKFAIVEAHPTSEGGVFVKAALQTSVGSAYFVTITFPNYPYQMPKVWVTRPALQSSPHKYNDGTICYLHPNMWNPGSHNLTFVLAHAAKWLNKYEVYRQKNNWPGAEMKH